MDISGVLTALKLTEAERRESLSLYGECINKLIQCDSFHKSFSKLSEHKDRVRFFQGQEAFRQFIVHLTEHCKLLPTVDKDVTRATKLRNDGNVAFVAQRYQLAFALYTEAIRYAPETRAVNDCESNNLKELPLAYGNRSATFFHLGQFEDSLKDIESALILGYSQYKPVTKLMLRKCECLLKLGRIEEAKKTLDTVVVEDALGTDGIRLNELYQQVCSNFFAFDNKMKETEFPKDMSSAIKWLTEKGRFQSQASFPSLSTKVGIHCGAPNNRHLVSTEDIHFGDILAVAEPYVTTMSREQEGHFCHHCLVPLTSKLVMGPSQKILTRSVPCSACTRVLYCSEQCRAKSWSSYHRAECSMLPILQQFLHNHLAWRTFLVAGGLNPIRKVAQTFQDLDVTNLADPLHYEHVYRMSLQSDLCVPMKTRNIIWHTFISCLFVKLAKIVYTGFFEEFIGSKEIGASAILLRHLEQIYFNCSILTKTSVLEVPLIPFHSLPEHKSEPFQAVHPLIGLVNRSCEPNISIRVLDSDGTGQQSNVVVFFANRSFPACTKITALLPEYANGTNKGIPLYSHIVSQYAIPHLWQTHLLPCSCEKCTLELRDHPYGPNQTDHPYYYPIGCSKCHGLLCRQSSTDLQYHCLDCSHVQSINEMKANYAALKSSFEISVLYTRTIMDEDFAAERYPPLLAQLDQLVTERMTTLLHRESFLLADHYKSLYHIHFKLSWLKDYFTRIFHREFRTAWKLANKVIDIFEHHYGTHSIPLMFHLMDMLRMFEDSIIDVEFGDCFRAEFVTDREHVKQQEWVERVALVRQRMLQMRQLYELV